VLNIHIDELIGQLKDGILFSTVKWRNVYQKVGLKTRAWTDWLK
jgi:hypothetical protein